MKAAPRLALTAAGLFAAFAASGALSALGAQGTIRRAPPADVARIMVPALRGSERNIGVQGADAIRSRLSQDIPYKSLWVIQKNDIAATLEASGFDPNQPLSLNDAKELAKLVRADEFLDGTVSRVPAGYRFDLRLVLSRDPAYIQPIPAVEGGRLDLTAAAFSRELQQARKQLDAEEACTNALRDGKYDEAITHAQKGIATYEKSTLARLCLANAYVLKKLPSDSILRVTSAVLAIDSTSRLALGWSADAYKERGDTSRAIAAWSKLIALDPKNTRLVDAVVREIASSGRYDVVKPIIRDAIAANPGDPSLMHLQFLILSASKDYKEAIAVGEQMVQTDTSLADAGYFTRLAGLYAADSQPQRSAEALARGIAKFPGNAEMTQLLAQQQRNAGQIQQSIATLRTLPAGTPRVNLLLAQAYVEMNQPDSALAALRTARTSDSASAIAPFALSIGNNIYRAAGPAKNKDDLKRALSFLSLSDTLSPSPQAKLLIGISSFTLGQIAATDAGKSKNCALAREAQEAFANASIAIPQGASVSQQAATQYMQYLQQFTPVVDNQVKQFCK